MPVIACTINIRKLKIWILLIILNKQTLKIDLQQFHGMKKDQLLYSIVIWLIEDCLSFIYEVAFKVLL